MEGTTENLETDIRCVSDARLWQFRTAASQSLVNYARQRLSRQLATSGASAEEVNQASNLFNPKALTLGFARRFATYKRPNLLLHDRERLLRLLSNTNRPVQLIIAGKRIRPTKRGRRSIREWINFIRQPNSRPHVIFLVDYDMLLTEHLVQGVDVWINTPRRPWEACGTSGMKVLVNGGINISELDGWWAEAYTPEVGWALGDGREHGDDPAWDRFEANALYELLENEIVPEFYDRDANGIPTAWVQRMRESMALLTPRFSANRTVREYAEQHYLPAAAAYRARCADKGAIGKAIVHWRESVEREWDALRFGEVRVHTSSEQHVFEVDFFLNNLAADAVRVELYADSIDGGEPVRQAMQCVGERAVPTANASRWGNYRAAVPATRPARDFTPRTIPQLAGVSVPLECSRILWKS